MSFVSRQIVRFAHVDAAGIVFYPRHFEMLNAALEDYFSHQRGVGFAELHLQRRIGTPLVHIEADFQAPARLGDELDIELRFQTVGRSSAKAIVTVTCSGAPRWKGGMVIACISLESGRSQPWPEDVRPGIDLFQA